MPLCFSWRLLFWILPLKQQRKSRQDRPQRPAVILLRMGHLEFRTDHRSRNEDMILNSKMKMRMSLVSLTSCWTRTLKRTRRTKISIPEADGPLLPDEVRLESKGALIGLKGPGTIGMWRRTITPTNAPDVRRGAGGTLLEEDHHPQDAAIVLGE